MSDGNTISFAAYAKAFGVRNAARDKEKRHRVTYPNAWQDLCREIMIAHKEETRIQLEYKRLGWQAIRDLVMQDYDQPNERAEVGRDKRLNRQDLEAWANGTYLNDDKFGFIDRYINGLRLDEEPHNELINAKQKYTIAQAAMISRMYQRRRLKSGMIDYLQEVTGEFLYTDEIDGSPYKHIVLRFEIASCNVIKISAAYCRFDITKQNPGEMANAVFYEGFLIPVPADNSESAKEPGLWGIRSDSWFCWLKLYRPEFQGSMIDGCADGRLEYLFIQPPESDFVHITINAKLPNSIFSPAGEHSLGNQSLRQAEENKSIIFQHDQKNRDFLARIFNECYKGYLF
ncbi:hypothetical protein SAMN05421538_11439 [Paracoccus isoporae]|uniref:Uncharacterized protein n=1 Tax=Paracoccus isoporae TaxID=591205 RepID=A0A1G7GQD0_9RHOB|nr:hypothetical protein [Paracoccus isoporae]SDE90378.1 hypothetical protein SAMN05421538_11439 [Paracoccus isoporae]